MAKPALFLVGLAVGFVAGALFMSIRTEKDVLRAMDNAMDSREAACCTHIRMIGAAGYCREGSMDRYARALGCDQLERERFGR